MTPEPATRAEVRGDAGGEEAEGDGKCAAYPAEFDLATQHKEIQHAEDEDQDGCLCKEGRAAAGGDGKELGKGPVCCDFALRRRHEDEARFGAFGTFFSGQNVCCIFVKHTQAFVVLVFKSARSRA